jgi:hypothetical protein
MSDEAPIRERDWRSTAQVALLAAGIGSAALYVATDVLVSVESASYSYWHQHISELMAIGSPTRPLALPLFLTTNVLLAAFGVGVWRSAPQKRTVRVVAVMLVAAAIIGTAVPLWAPMQVRAAGQTGNEHLIGTALNVLAYLLAVGFGAAAFGKRFRFYSIATIVVLLAAGAWAAMDASAIGADQVTPWTGIKERINIYGIQLWVAVLSISLLREHLIARTQAEADPEATRANVLSTPARSSRT